MFSVKLLTSLSWVHVEAHVQCWPHMETTHLRLTPGTPKQRKYVDTYLCWSRCLFRGKFHMLISPFLPEFLHLVTCTMNQPVVLELCLVLTNSTLHLHPLDPKILGSEFWPSACLPCTWWFIACSGIPITVCWLHFRTQTTSFCIFDARSLFG